MIQRFRRFSELQPGNALALYYYAMSLWKGKRAEDPGFDLQEVESLLQKSVALDPKLAEAHVQLGNLYADQHEYAKSIPEYTEALELNPNLPDAHYRLGQDYVHVGQKDRAQAEFDVYQQLRAQHMAEVDKERAEVQQFVYSAKAAPSTNPHSRSALQSMTDTPTTPRQLAHHLGRTRRDFLRDAAGVAVGSTLMSASPLVRGATAAEKRERPSSSPLVEALAIRRRSPPRDRRIFLICSTNSSPRRVSSPRW